MRLRLLLPLLALTPAAFGDDVTGTVMDIINPDPNGYAGSAVAVSGATALIGIPLREWFGGANEQGVVSVTTWSGCAWSWKDMLVAPDRGASDHFGSALALEGTLAVVGAQEHDGPAGPDQGSVYLYSPNWNNDWTLDQQLWASSGAANDLFGSALAVEGSTLVVGASGAQAVYEFTFTGGTWSESARLTPSASAPSFGAALALSGNRLIVGAPGANNGAGAAFVFTRAAGVWTEVAKFESAIAGPSAGFGVAVALDGSRAVVGASAALSRGGVPRGAAFLFEDGPLGWNQVTMLSPPGSGSGSLFGASVAVEDDVLVVGAPGMKATTLAAYGLAFSYQRGNGNWPRIHRLLVPGGAPSDDFGSSIDLQSGIAMVGAPGLDLPGGSNQGAALWTALPADCDCDLIGDDLELALGLDTDFNGDGTLDGCQAVGAPYCGNQSSNSSGLVAQIIAFGSTSISTNALHLRQVGGPLGGNDVGFFLIGTMSANKNLPNSSGRLCVGGAIVRVMSSVQALGVNGTMYHQLDLNALPNNSGGSYPALPGMTRYFQTWFRDSADTPPSNLSTAVAVTFTL